MLPKSPSPRTSLLNPRRLDLRGKKMPIYSPEAVQQPRHCSAEFMGLLLTLMSRGYVVEARAARRASFTAKVINQLDVPVGEIQYRDPVDEPNEQAQGISYSSFDSHRDATFELVMQVLK